MSIQEVSAEQLAELFHHYHQALRPDFAGTRDATPESWSDVPAQERNRMVAAVRLALIDLDTARRYGGHKEQSKQYFAKPGEAEWGC